MSIAARMLFAVSPAEPIVLYPYQWSVRQTVTKVLLYPCVLGVVAALVGLMAGNPSLGLVLLLAFPLVSLPVAAVAGALVKANRGTVVTAEAGQVVKRGALGTASCPRRELDAIVYSTPLRGAIECQFLRKDGGTAFRITLAPWVALQQDLKRFAGALDLPLRPNRFARNFRL
jgi:hypothetical protein